MKKKLLLLFLLIGVKSFCQRDLLSNEKIKKGIGITCTPHYSVLLNVQNNEQKVIKGRLAGSIGVCGNFVISKKRNIFQFKSHEKV